MSQATKDLLAAAAGPNGKGDELWHAARAERLYFFDQHDVNAAGSVDVIHEDGKEPEYVRVELFVKASLAAEVIALVTGETQSIETRMRQLYTTKEPQEEAPPPAPAPTPPQSIYAAGDAAAEKLAREDDERMKELNRLIKQQDEDDKAAANGEVAEDEEDEPESDDEPEAADPFVDEPEANDDPEPDPVDDDEWPEDMSTANDEDAEEEDEDLDEIVIPNGLGTVSSPVDLTGGDEE